MEKLYSVQEAALLLGGVSKWTVHAWLSKGKMKRTKVGRRTMIRESELQRMVQDGGVSTSPNKFQRKRSPRSPV
jgi:excisionase family DNA binding protein